MGIVEYDRATLRIEFITHSLRCKCEILHAMREAPRKSHEAKHSVADVLYCLFNMRNVGRQTSSVKTIRNPDGSSTLRRVWTTKHSCQASLLRDRRVAKRWNIKANNASVRF
jgi:hypothetical protein